MIDEPRPCGRSSPDPKEETIMFKTISAALLAVSVLAAPALAATSGKIKEAPVIKSVPVKASVLNANARMEHGHHHRHYRHYRHHRHVGAIKTHTKVSFKQAKPSTRRS
jgi:hypothetical protein